MNVPFHPYQDRRPSRFGAGRAELPKQETAPLPAPVSQTQYEQMIQLLQTRITTQTLSQIAVPTPNGCEFIQIQDILRLEAEGNYTRIHVEGKVTYLASRTLIEYERLLAHKGFFRIHRSHLINLSFLKRYFKGKQAYVIMANGDSLDVSKRKKEEFINYLNQCM